MTINRLYKLLSISIVFLCNMAVAQSLKYGDLLNLQKADFDKAKGFFQYKGFNWQNAEKSKAYFEYNGFAVNADPVTWIKYGEKVIYEKNDNCQNILLYYPDNQSFFDLENETKKYLKSAGTKSDNNIMSTTYSGGGMEMTFNTKKTPGWDGSTIYEVCLYNVADVQKRISMLCSFCKGKGQIIDHAKCGRCGGTGKQSCNECSGTGKIVCTYCKEGKVQCDKCWGKRTIQCSKCDGRGKINCTRCYGEGTISCTACAGTGHQTYFGITAPCAACKGKGRKPCPDCDGKGSSICAECAGAGFYKCPKCDSIGVLTCPHCNGNYSTTCTKCNGTGHNDMACSYCGGIGLSAEEIRKTCPYCDGTGQKTK